jgi:uncharacterized protein (DUF2141 family)
MRLVKTIITFLFLIAFLRISAQTLTIHIAGIRNAEGNIRLGFYTNAESFDKEEALFIRNVPKTTLSKGQLTIAYSDIKPGTYGIAVLDDENTNQKMDYGLILPKEGFGFSDYYHTGMTKPKFSQFDFVLGKDPKAVTIVLRYL